MIKKGSYKDVKNNNIVEVIGETEFSHISDDPTAEHISMQHYENGNVEVAFILNGSMITNNALGILVLFKKGRKTYYLSKKIFEGEFRDNGVSKKRFEHEA